jgi:hypothetical protein
MANAFLAWRTFTKVARLRAQRNHAMRFCPPSPVFTPLPG